MTIVAMRNIIVPDLKVHIIKHFIFIWFWSSIPRCLTWSENSGCTNTLFNKLHWSLNVSSFNISWVIWVLRLYLLRRCAFDDEDWDVVLDAVRVETVLLEPETISVESKLWSGVPTSSLSNVMVLSFCLALAVFILRLYCPHLPLLKLEHHH